MKNLFPALVFFGLDKTGKNKKPKDREAYNHYREKSKRVFKHINKQAK
jgi:hypothetical protein